MVTSRQAASAALRIAWRIGGRRLAGELRRVISRHGTDAVVAVLSAAMQRSGISEQEVINLVTPEHGGSVVKSPAFNRLGENVKRKLEFGEADGPASKIRRVGSAQKFSQSKMPRNIRTGVYQGKFRRGKKVKGKSRFTCVCKDERPIQLATAPSTLYTMHSTHPQKYVMRMIGMSMVHEYMRQCDIKIPSWTSLCSITPLVGVTASPGFQVEAIFSRRQGTTASGLADVESATLFANVADSTFLDVADGIGDQLVALTTTFSNDIHIHEIRWLPANVGTVLIQLALKVWSADEMIIGVRGESHMQIQNRTLAGDAGASSETTSIFANPLEGRSYVFGGSSLRMAAQARADQTTGGSTEYYSIATSTTTGVFQFASTSTDFPDSVKDNLKQPPDARIFRRIKSVGKVRLEPGAIKKHHLVAYESHTLNVWMKKLFSYMSSGTALGITAGTFESGPGVASGSTSVFHESHIGKSGLIALEKVADLGEASVNTPGERDAIYSSVLKFRRRFFVPGTNSQMPTTGAFVPV